METYKKYINEEFDEDMQNYVYGPFMKAVENAKIGKWSLSINNMAGAFEWSRRDSDYIVYASPYWDGEDWGHTISSCL